MINDKYILNKKWRCSELAFETNRADSETVGLQNCNFVLTLDV